MNRKLWKQVVREGHPVGPAGITGDGAHGCFLGAGALPALRFVSLPFFFHFRKEI